MDVVPVDYQDFDDKPMEIAHLNADNLSAEISKYDTKSFHDSIRNLDLDEDFDLELFGVPDFELPEIKEFESEEDEIPESAETRCKDGDLWKLGEHRLLCGDSTNVQHVERLMGGAKADMVFTDPPYGIGFKYNSHQDSTGDEYMDFCRDWFHNLKPLSDFIVISTGWAYNKFWYSYDPDDCFYWLSRNKRTGGSRSFFRKIEPLFMWGRPNEKYDFDFFEQTSEIEQELKGKHTCPKPVSLIEKIIEKGGKTVLDFFGGSGTTLIACEKTNRKCFMMELDPHYCDVILTRWERFTGKTAELLNGQEEG
jgi:site-specific DNA-methyltransferase (adenine-specific)